MHPLRIRLRLITKGERIFRRLPEPEALDAEEERDHARCGNRQVGGAGRNVGELGDRVLPHRLYELHAPLHHEDADDSHADIAGECRRSRLTGFTMLRTVPTAMCALAR